MPWNKIDRIRGINGSDGANGENGINGSAVLHGPGSPSNSIGANGDFYVDTDNNRFFGPKSSGTWSGFVSMVGIQGPIGPTGASGGVGPAGSQGIQGISGSQGIQGPAGSAGSIGAAGIDGKTLLNGSGAPSGSLGATGDFYIDKTAWTIYGPKTIGTGWGSATNIIGPSGAAATVSVGAVTGIAAGQSPTVTNTGTSSAAVLAFAIPAGATGATGPAGTTLVGTATITETAALAINAGLRKVNVTVSGVVAGGCYAFVPTSATPAGYAIHDVVATATNTLQCTLSVPLIVLGATYSIVGKVFRLG